MGEVREKRVALVPGDGIGAEVTAEAVRILDLLKGRGLPVTVHPFDYSAERYIATGQSFPPGAIDDLASHDAIFMGAFGDPRVPDMAHARDILLGTRRELDLYVNFRPVRPLDRSLMPLKRTGAKPPDFVIMRENTEGSYLGSGGFLKKGTPQEVAVENSLATRAGVERILRYAFSFARAHGRGSVVMADKHNAQKFAGDLWRRAFEEVASDFKEIQARHLFVDHLCMEMILDPWQFEVIVTDNLFGDIASDLGAALQGGAGMAPSANFNPETGAAMFEPVHGSAPRLAGRGLANPMAALLTCVLLLRFLDFGREARALESAVAGCVRAGETTPDLGGSLETRAVGEAVACRLEAELVAAEVAGAEEGAATPPAWA